jgi:hypothetical protein
LPDPPAACPGTTSGAGDDVALGCVPGDGEDVTYLFVAPSDAHYVFTTFEEAPASDTALQVMTTGGAVLGCSGDIGDFSGAASFYTTGLVHLDLAAGQTVEVIVEHEGGLGEFLVSVSIGAIPGGSCCFEGANAGCDVPEIEDCACLLDPYCCDMAWDALCVGLALATCDADCA